MLLPILLAIFCIIVGFIIYANWPQEAKPVTTPSPCKSCGAPPGGCHHEQPTSYCDHCGKPKAQCGCPSNACKQCGQPKAQCGCPPNGQNKTCSFC